MLVEVSFWARKGLSESMLCETATVSVFPADLSSSAAAVPGTATRETAVTPAASSSRSALWAAEAGRGGAFVTMTMGRDLASGDLSWILG